jgi:polyhydroxyalkanoate synthesis repressor PhaR
MGKSSGKITIKKYANRRLYDTESSSYITLDRLGAMIREGRDFEVIDAKTGDDITHQVLTQIIVEEESRGEGATMLPVNFLRQLIGFYGGQMQPAVPQYLDAAMDMFQKNQAAMRDAVSAPFGGGATMFADLAKRNMAMFEEAGRAFVPGAAKRTADKPAAGDTASEVDQLRAELAALQAKVDKLGK